MPDSVAPAGPAAPGVEKRVGETGPAQSDASSSSSGLWEVIGGLHGIPNRMFAAAAASSGDLTDLLGALDDRRSNALALQLQRSVGNAYLAGSVLRRPSQRIVVQRCGAEVHHGCPCAQQQAKPAASTDVADIQRQGPDVQPSPGELKADSPYRRLPAGLLSVIKKSYLDKTMLFGHGDQETLDDVLERLSTSTINAMVKIFSRGAAVWGFVDTITWVWITDNYGMSFKSKGGDPGGALKDDPAFCKDSSLGQIYHSGSECWREMTAGGAGLHVCVGAETSMHVDPHMPVKQKGGGSTGAGALKGAAIGSLFGPFGILVGAGIGAAVGTATGGGTSELGDICVYDVQLWISHASDVLSGKAGPDVFSRVDTARSDLDQLGKHIDYLPPSKAKTRLAADVQAARVVFRKVLDATRSAASRPIDGNRPLDQQVGESATEVEPHLPDLERVEAEIIRIRPEVDELAVAAAPRLAGGARPAAPPPPPPPTAGPAPVPTN